MMNPVNVSPTSPLLQKCHGDASYTPRVVRVEASPLIGMYKLRTVICRLEGSEFWGDGALTVDLLFSSG